MIILNDDVFEGEEKKVFSNVKEKSVSKFLYFNPTIEELFNTIFEQRINKSIKRYKNLIKYKKIILSVIEEVEELNARIYIQILDKLLEGIEKKGNMSESFIRFFIFNHINFILNHHVFIVKKERKTDANLLKSFYPSQKEVKSIKYTYIVVIKSKIELIKSINLNKLYLNNLEQLRIDFSGKNRELDFINENESLVSSYIMLNIMNKRNVIEGNNRAESNVFNEMSKFIETGILED